MIAASRRLLLYAVPILLSIFLYRYALTSWFRTDDFAWLHLNIEATSWDGVADVLFGPRAQGTVRIWSDRVFFLVFKFLFGSNALPFHLWMFATHAVNLYLLSRLTERWTGSAVAGMLAAIAWTVNPALATPLSWASAYNQILCGFFLLAATWFLVRWLDTGQRAYAVAMWSFYLLGFGALELMIVFPVLALAMTWMLSPSQWRKTLPLWIPAVAFVALHLFVIPKAQGPVYAMSFDADLPRTLARYVVWAIGPIRLGEFGFPKLARWGLRITILFGAGLAAFLLWKIAARNRLAVFLLVWVIALLAPVLPLKNHITDYYLALPTIGIAVAVGWAVVDLWPRGPWLRFVAALLSVVCCAGMALETVAVTRWYKESTSGLKRVFQAVLAEHRIHPDRMILLNGVDDELFATGFQDMPFAAFEINAVYLAPGSESVVHGREDLDGASRYQIAPEKVRSAAEAGELTLLQITRDRILDETSSYLAMLHASGRAGSVIRVGEPAFASSLGAGWFEPENGFRWMGKSAAVRIGGPRTRLERVVVTGYAPKVLLAKRPLSVTAWADGEELGECRVEYPDEAFELSYPVSEKSVGRPEMELRLEVNRTYRPAGDPRELGVVIATVSLK